MEVDTKFLDENGYDLVHFYDGAVIDRELTYMIGNYDRYDPSYHAPHSLALMFDERELYGDDPLPFEAVSICGHKDGEKPTVIAILSKNGHVRLVWGGEKLTRADERIPDAGIRDGGKYGYLAQIAHIGATFYACGSHGQVYRRTPSGWIHADEGILDPGFDRSLTLTSISGSAEDDIFVVGWHGRILHFDGDRWTELDSPTNIHLERVLSVGRGEAYVCGNEGTLLRVHPGGIENLCADTDAHFWGLAVLDGRVFVSSLLSIYELIDGELEEVDTGLDGVEFYRLVANDGTMWSFAAKDVVRFDGETWEHVPVLWAPPEDEDAS